MKSYRNLVYTQADGIATIVLDRPKALNALNLEMLGELEDVISQLERDNTIKVVILSGSGSKAFAAGADIGEMHPLTAQEGRKWALHGQRIFRRLECLPQPVIAAVNGFALGGGCELILACDIRIAAEHAKFAQPEVSLGITAGFGGTQRLARLIGAGRAKELLFTGEMIHAAEAYRIGLVNRVVPAEEVLPVARQLAAKICAQAQVAVQLSKAAVNRGLEMDLEAGIAYEAEVFALCFATADQKEGMAAFAEKRKAVFGGR